MLVNSILHIQQYPITYNAVNLVNENDAIAKFIDTLENRSKDLLTLSIVFRHNAFERDDDQRCVNIMGDDSSHSSLNRNNMR